MGRAINLAEYQLMKHFRTTNECPYGTKKMMDSTKVCRKRFEASEKARLEMISRRGLFIYTVEHGFLRCKSCPIIKGLPDQALEAPLSHITNL